MEQQEIGTKATRADVIQTLYDRKYVRDEKIAATDLGFEVLNVLEKHCPSMVSISLTRKLEDKMERIRTSNEKREAVLTETIDILKPVLAKVKENEKTIGEQLSNAVRNAKAEERVVGTCPVCETGRLMILYSRKTRNRFVGCSNFFRGLCKASAPLPQKGAVEPLGKVCNACCWPLVQVAMRGKRPWRLCLNPECPLKKEPRQK
jgi:DNA topoisomerase-1